jgi:hypothetical protein
MGLLGVKQMNNTKHLVTTLMAHDSRVYQINTSRLSTYIAKGQTDVLKIKIGNDSSKKEKEEESAE